MRLPRPAAYAAFCAAMLLVACAANNPLTYADTTLDKAHVALRTFENVQEEILPVVNDESVPESVKETLRTASHDGTLAAEQLGGGVTEFEAARSAMAAGETTNERLVIANANLVAWTQTLQERIASIKAAAKEARP